jgi:GNAT superfamily N-acetyltransferase
VTFVGTIRPAQREDSARIAELATQLGYPSSADEITRRLEQIQLSNESSVFVAELSQGEIAGWIGMFVFRSIADEPRVEVSGLVVDEKRRSQGIGEKLLERAERWAREKGCRAIGLRCNVIRERAHVFYLRQGYEDKKTQKSFRKHLDG